MSTTLSDNFFPDLLLALSAAPLKVAFYTDNKPTSYAEYDTTNESSGVGYTAGGIAVGATWSLNPSSRNYSLTISTMAFSGASIFVQTMVLYRADTGRVLAVIPTGGVTVTGAAYDINFPNPVFQIQV